jgi:hypothetical protein|tara:strand:- start:37 stop:324 length:288 start_codon:yes stop_codon:yes gene_type:complete
MNKEILIDQYRGQLAIKTDLLKNKNEQYKLLDNKYKAEMVIIKNDTADELKNLKLKHEKEIEALKELHNKLIYTSERKNKKLEESNKSWKNWWYM